MMVAPAWRPKAAPALTTDTLYPRDAENRYRIYVRNDDGLAVLCTTSTPAGIGVALCTIHEDQKSVGLRLADLGAIGILDVLADGANGEWIVMPWHRSSPAPTRKETPVSTIKKYAYVGPAGQEPPAYARVAAVLSDEELEAEILAKLGEPGYQAALVAELERRSREGSPE